MLNFSLIELSRKHGKKIDKTLKQQFVNFYRMFRFVPCFLHRPLEAIRKRTKCLSIIIEFKDDQYHYGLNDVKKLKSRKLREFPSISSCSLPLSIKHITQLLNTCDHIQKIHYDREVTALLDKATPSINADQLQENSLTGKNTTIAIIDTGIHPHDDLKGRIAAFKDFAGNKDKPYDDNGHGTHCAGDAAGNGAVSDGKYKGPAPDANLVGVKVLNKKGSGSLSTVMDGIEWCLQNQAEYNINILSLSFGFEAKESADEDPLVKAVETAWDQGVIVCAAAGNSGPEKETIGSPATSPKIITVGAADDHNNKNRSNDSVAGFSSRGPTIDGHIKPDLLTPGVDITSLRAPKSYLDKVNKDARIGSQYFALSGTSMAAPICAGVAAQLLQGHPDMTPSQVKEELKDAGEDLGRSSTVQGSGYLNARKLQDN